MGEPIENPAIADEQRFDQAAEAIEEAAANGPPPDGDDSDLVESLDSVEAATDGTVEPDAADDAEVAGATEEPAEGAEAAAEAKEEPPAEDEAPKAGEVAWRHAQARRKERQAERRLAEVDQRLAAIEKREQSLAELPDPRTDPIAFHEAMAQRAGLTPAQYLERINGVYLKDGEPDPSSEIAMVRQELAELKAERERETRAQQQAQAVQAQQNEIDTAVQEVMALHDPKLAEAEPEVAKQAAARWPWVSKANPKAVQRELQWAASATYRAWQQAGELHLHDRHELMAEAADRVEERMSGLLGAPPQQTTEDPATSETGDGQGKPDALKASKPAGDKQPRTLTNKDAASGGTSRRKLEGDERLDYAGAALLG